MCKFADLRLIEVKQDRDPEWFTTNSYTLMFDGSSGFFDDQWHSQDTTYGPDLYDGKRVYRCNNCREEFSTFAWAQRHVDEEPDEDPKILKWFGVQ